MRTFEKILATPLLLCTNRQSDYYKFILNNLQPGECLVIVDYRMKLELGICSRETQHVWCGPKLEIAKEGEVIDLWS